MSAIPAVGDSGQNVAFALENMIGFSGSAAAGADLQAVHGSNFKSGSALTVNTAPIQLKFAVPMQYGFDGDNPSHKKHQHEILPYLLHDL